MTTAEAEMKWTEHSANHHTASGPGGKWSVEKRIGVWMVFDPREDEAVFVGAASLEHAKLVAENLAEQWAAE